MSPSIEADSGRGRRVLHVSRSFYFDTSNGASVANRALMEGLVRRGFAAEAVCGSIVEAGVAIDPASVLGTLIPQTESIDGDPPLLLGTRKGREKGTEMNGTSCGFKARIWAIWGTLILPRLLPIFLGDVPFGTEIIIRINYLRPLFSSGRRCCEGWCGSGWRGGASGNRSGTSAGSSARRTSVHASSASSRVATSAPSAPAANSVSGV